MGVLAALALGIGAVIYLQGAKKGTSKTPVTSSFLPGLATSGISQAVSGISSNGTVTGVNSTGVVSQSSGANIVASKQINNNNTMLQEMGSIANMNRINPGSGNSLANQINKTTNPFKNFGGI